MLNARVVIDTNVLISGALLPNSVSARAVRRATDRTTMLMSKATLTELAEVLSRPKFDEYVSVEDRQAFFLSLTSFIETVPITTTVRACRDPKDDKFLELALSGNASLILTGDRDLLALAAYDGVAIVTPAQFLAMPDSALVRNTDGQS